MLNVIFGLLIAGSVTATLGPVAGMIVFIVYGFAVHLEGEKKARIDAELDKIDKDDSGWQPDACDNYFLNKNKK